MPPVNPPPSGSRRPLPAAGDRETGLREPAQTRPHAESSHRGAGDLGRLASRQSLPTLPISPARAQLWKYTRIPAQELLLPTGSSSRCGQPVSASAMAAPVSGLALPAMLPIPAAPRLSLPTGEAPDVAAARALVVGWLHELRGVAAAQAVMHQFGARGVPSFVLESGGRRQSLHAGTAYSDPAAFVAQVTAA